MINVNYKSNLLYPKELMSQLHLSPLKLVEIFVSVDDFLINFSSVLQKYLGEDK
ncbi:MAG: hypothetical protein OHK0038_00870 [Flammeovirgaceae bacterium]